MKLYSYWRSSSSWRVRLALALKGIPYTYVPVNVIKNGGEQHSESYRGMNPMQQVPLLELEVDGVVQRIAQSMAIVSYLEEIQPTPPLLPAEPLRRAWARQAAEIVNSGIQPMHDLAVLNRVVELHGADRQRWAQHWIRRGLEALELMLRQTASRFAVGDTVTLADLFLVPQLYQARRHDVDTTPYPTLQRVEAECQALPAFIAAHPDQQPDAMRNV